MGKKYETIFEGTKMSIFSSMILKIVLILLRKRRKKKKETNFFFRSLNLQSRTSMQI